MTKVILALIILIGLAFGFKSNKINKIEDPKQGIQFFKGTWKDALQKAKSENKLIFLDIYATWCGPCKRLKSQTFSNAQVGSYFNDRFINVALDGEQSDGLQLVNTYGIKSYPSLLFIDNQGKIVKRTVGFHTSENLLLFAKTVSK